MNASLTRIAPTVSQSAVVASILNPLSCLRPDGTLYDFLFMESSAFVGWAGSLGAYGSLTNGNGQFAGGGVGAFSPVCGWRASDGTLAMTSTVSFGLMIFPVNFLWFYPVTLTYTGAGAATFDVFGL